MPAPKAEAAATLAAVLAEARLRLAGGDIDDPALEARMIIEHFTGTERKDAIASPGRPILPGELARIDDALSRRLAGEPVHRIFGWRDFYGLRLKLSPDTLEPRPDTETLVDAVLPFLREAVRREGRCRVLDLGTGTGAIALAIAAQVPEAIVTATDISAGALDTAMENATGLRLSARFIPLVSDWFSAVDGKFHAIVSNPPYIETQAIGGLQPEVKLYDPIGALDGGVDGLDPYRAIAAGAAEHLGENGIVVVEIGEGQGRHVALIFAEAGFRKVSAHCDLAGTERALVFEQ
jgi:release factor glutamine methyltransferase